MIKRAVSKLKYLLRPGSAPQPINAYWWQLSTADIAAGRHRSFVGGMWDEIGRLQLDFMKGQGLQPGHKLADVGCGPLRGGLHFVRYLDKGNYHGIDINRSLIKAGRKELDDAGLSGKEPALLVNDKFDLSPFGIKFDYAIAVSLFTHLYMNHIVRCLAGVNQTLKPVGKFYASFFEAPYPAHFSPIKHSPGDITTNFDADPFHYSFPEMETLADEVGMGVELVGDWGHPRNQKMLCFVKRARPNRRAHGLAGSEPET